MSHTDTEDNDASAPSFAKALITMRRALGLSQADLSSGRSYVSALERGLKQPSIGKVSELAASAGIHPATLAVLAFADDIEDAFAVLGKVNEELAALDRGYEQRMG